MVKHLIDHIMSPNTDLNTEVNICRSLDSSTFVKVSTYLSTMVERIYASTKPPPGCFRKRSTYAAGRGYRGSRRGGRFDGRDCSRGRKVRDV